MKPRILRAITVLLVTLVAARAETPDEAVQALVGAERKFAQAAQEKGTRAAFMEFLAPDGVVFRPGPVNGQDAWSKRTQPDFDLVWEPTFAVIARSGDFGYDTGPAKWRAKKEGTFTGFGHFISIWKKQKDGAWKVAVDCGIEHPEPNGEPEALRTAVAGSLRKDDAEIWAGAMKNFHEMARADSAKAIAQFATPGIRVYRDGQVPAVGKGATESLLAQMSGKTTYGSSVVGDSSGSQDLAYAYGEYTTVRGESTERGHYLQIWQTDNSGAWKLALDWQKPLPPKL